jgi:sialate O-acetylesterase
MHIATGLFDHMVLQRTGRDVSNALITGATSASGPVRAQVRLKNRTVRGFAGKTIGKAANGKFTATLAGLPAGGPYAITLAIGDDNHTVKDVLVGDVWIAAGQSNMQGVGLLSEAAPPHPLCRAFYLDDRWDVARDPINNTRIAVDEVHAIRNAAKPPTPKVVTGTGPAVAFIQEMHRVTGVPQGVIASSHGGTSMDEWSPKKKSLGSKSFYGATLRRFEKNGGKVAGMIWYQGESETGNADNAASYPQRMKTLVRSFRRDLRDKNLPIAAVQIARVVGHSTFIHWNTIQEHQRRLPENIPNLTVVPAVDLDLDDGIHIGGQGPNRLGRRLANAMLSLIRHPKSQPPPITPGKISTELPAGRTLANIVIQFNNVVGKLTAARPSGFSLLDDTGLNFIFDVKLRKNRTILRTDCSLEQLAGKKLHYGHGFNPVCTITDSTDRSLPAFGPIVLPASKRRR